MLQTHSNATSSGMIESANEPAVGLVAAPETKFDQGYVTPIQVENPDEVQVEVKPCSNRWKRKHPQTFNMKDEDKFMEQDLADEFPDDAFIQKHHLHYSHVTSVPDEFPDDPAELGDANKTVEALNNT
eukprot:CAMPEP_0170510258 /NCGR_PEP_ID=MMETSP0208-20121228/65671_1 /TAXON_ID=197538 /ORGANISM="Strombidium inclinatum, Strain S3" /LENGTH=127 /DNA_ID=CAMNT_0010793709 /DNA_START=1204 /DNA_END=1587 /DNA_ORIENTATION=-